MAGETPPVPSPAGTGVGAEELGTRDRLVVTAGELLRRRGYAATGLKAVLAASGVRSGSLYHFFPGGKEELAVEAVVRSGGAYRELVEAYLPPGVDVVAAVGAMFADAADMLESTGYAEACPIAAIALETADHSPALRDAASAMFASWLAVIATRLVEAGTDATTAERLAQQLFMLLQGGFLLARVQRDADPLRHAAPTAAGLVRDALAGVTTGA